MSAFQLNRQFGKAQSLSSAADHREYYQKMTWKERLAVAAYLNSVAYQYDPAHPPAMNRQVFRAKSLSD